MLGDAIVYGVSLWAVNCGARWEAGAALVKGLLILAFFVFIVVEVVSKLVHGVPRSSGLMLGFGAIPLVTNLLCPAVLWRFRTLNINMKSTFECSSNDVAANIGVLVAAGGVALTGSGWPDIAAGAVIALFFLKSALGVIGRHGPRGVQRSCSKALGHALATIRLRGVYLVRLHGVLK